MPHPFETSLRAFHNDPDVQATYLARVQMHHDADEIVKGIYWEHGKGCAVGCTIHSGEHASYENELGIPRILARLEDHLFESMENGKAKAWPLRFLSAVPLGADLSLVWPQFAVWMLTDATHGVLQYADSDRVRKSITDVAALYERIVAGESVSQTEFYASAASAAAASAAAASASASYAAASASASYAAASAASAASASYAASAASASYAASAASAASAAASRSRFALAASNRIEELLVNAPVPVAA